MVDETDTKVRIHDIIRLKELRQKLILANPRIEPRGRE